MNKNSHVALLFFIYPTDPKGFPADEASDTLGVFFVSGASESLPDKNDQHDRRDG